MISAFSLLFASALFSPMLHRSRWLTPMSAAAIIGSIYLVLIALPIGLNGFESTPAVTLFEVILLVVLLAVILHEDDPLSITQTLFIGTASIALLQSSTLLNFVISFEAVSIISFILVSHIRTADQAEGAVKMFIAGAIATGLLLLGVAFYTIGGGRLLYSLESHLSSISLVGVFVMLLGIFYKLTIVPMHGWAADTYALVRPSHAAILSGVAKTVVALAAFRIFAPALSESISISLPLLSILAVLTMTLGNVLALFHKTLSKILAYSSIAHAGYLLLAFAAVKSQYAHTGLLYMSIAYIFMQTAVFLVLDTLRKRYAIGSLEELQGFHSKNPLLAFFFSVQLFSLAGIPLLAGFLGKAVVFYAAVDAGIWYVVLIALLNSALSVGYYGWIIKHLYFDAPSKREARDDLREQKLPLLAQGILLAGTLYFGIFASLVFSATSNLQ